MFKCSSDGTLDSNELAPVKVRLLSIEEKTVYIFLIIQHTNNLMFFNMYHVLPLSISIVLLFTLIYLESCDDCSNPNICIMHECYHTELNLTLVSEFDVLSRKMQKWPWDQKKSKPD